MMPVLLWPRFEIKNKKIKLAGWGKKSKPLKQSQNSLNYLLQLDQASDQKLLQNFLKYSKLHFFFFILLL